ncbi:MAG: hypothetical protein L6R35_000914 [Caloplaca aegaea]|nr:MAG: hypothetical protein L6R35_000914 [Caloplaca aegaea]
MPTSRIRGGTPYSYHEEQHSINDPKLTALLDELGQHNRSWAAEHLQAAAEAARAAYQPPPDIYTPDRELSPPAPGLLSPAASPPDPYPQHDTTSPSYPAVGDVTALQPANWEVGDLEMVLHRLNRKLTPFQPSKTTQSSRTFHQQEHGNPANFSPILSPNAISNNLADDQNQLVRRKPRPLGQSVVIRELSPLGQSPPQLSPSAAIEQQIPQQSIIMTRSRVLARKSKTTVECMQ